MKMENLTPEQWREIVNKKFRFPPELLGAIREGNIHMVSSLLKTGDGIIRQLDDSEDRLWREALNLSIRLGNEDTMDSLLQGIKFDFRQIHEALLVAVDTNQPRVVKRLLDRLDLEKGNKMDVRSFSMAIFDHSIDDSQFAPGVTPLTLACQKDLYEIVTMLKQKGHEIPWPHKISCSCLECTNGRQYDLLKFSLSRINTYRGIASRAYLSITSEDAMLSAFRLSRDLRKLSKKEPEFKPQYLSLEEICQEFAVELLGMCRNQSEVTTILNSCSHMDEDSEDELNHQAFEEGIPNLARLRLAVNYNQKQFVAHPICQQVLSSIWCGSLSGWKGSRTTWKLLVSFVIFLTMPFLCLIYWIAPKSKLGKILKIPVIKFLLHSASYMWFLITLLGESIAMEIYRESFASRHQNILHNSFHMVWVVGFFWFECKEVWIEGLRCYFLDWWNCLDMMVLSMYLASFALRVVIMLKGIFLCESPESHDECIYFTDTLRDRWHQEDPQFIAEVLFAVTSMLSFTRLAYILPAQESLGTLQISIGKMIDDMMRFMFILVIIGTAFLCGINNTYVPYVISPNLGRLNETFRFLFWTMFGVAEQTYVDMPEFVLAEFVGRILYGIYTLIIVIVLLNMLIAMITNSFQKIEDDADVEWKFARSKLYLSYFREGLTMPVPFNIIPSPKALFYLLRGTFRRICCCCLNCNSAPDYPPISSLDDKGTGEGRISYRHQVIRALVQRYIESARREFEEAKRKDVGNRITELSKVVVRLHTEMKQINSGLLDYSGNTSAGPSEGSSFLGKYIVGAKNNFKDFSTERKPAPLTTPVYHEEQEDDPEETGRDGETTDTQESPACDTEEDKESTEEQTSEGGIDNVIEEHTVDIDETDGNDEDVQISVENNTDSEQTEDKNETVIDIETNTDTESESERDSGGADETAMREEATDNAEGLETDEGSETTDANESEENEAHTVCDARTEMQENEDGEGNDGGLEDTNDRSQCEGSEESEEMSIDLNKGSLVTFLAKRIGEKLETKDMKLIFSGKQASSSPTGSDVSHDTGFGSQFDLSANSPE
ncbi:transient receptor potential cation channel subfamily C member 2b [Triplophysa rosa]|nr:transient receptor potential cation channel subfamily C member 2b [Triplophysa rosa]